ncbi:MAG: hypothetical protein JW795_09185 [Chitinivibrionales bacterium]|nr:hypothetical protein [Chitinivibrionales bacterium]
MKTAHGLIKNAIVVIVCIHFLSAMQADKGGDGIPRDCSFTADGVRSFAHYLMGKGDYRRAAEEFKRALFLSDTTNRSDALLDTIALCYEKSGDFDNAGRYYQRIFTAPSHVPLSDTAQHSRSIQPIYYPHQGLQNSTARQARFNLGRIRFLQQRYTESRAILGGLAGKDTTGTFLALTIASLISEKKWDTAAEQLQLYRPSAQTDSMMKAMLGSLTAQYRLKEVKHAPLAAALSAMVPGLGKVYTGDYRDGLVSFVIVGLCAAQSWLGFRKNHSSSVRGWVFASFGTLFYSGNIYGSAVAAHVYNEKSDDALVRKFLLRIQTHRRIL